MSAERVACRACGRWMFHLAKSCPHCGGSQSPPDAESAKPVAPPKPPAPLTLTPEEARALLAATPGPPTARVSLGAVAGELVLPRAGAAELVLTVLAAPLTVSTVVTLGYVLLRERRARRDERLQGARLLAVPACTALLAVSLWGAGLPEWLWGPVGASFLSWVVRELLRASRHRDPLL